MHRLVVFLALLSLGSVSASAAPPRLTGAFKDSGEAAARRSGSAPGMIWDSAHPDGSAQGRLELPLASLPTVLELNTAGYPDNGPLRLILESPDGTRQLKLGFRSPPGSDWTLHRWTIPAEWRGQPAVLIARDQSTEQWIGVGLPPSAATTRSANWFALGSTLGATLLTVLPFFIALFLLRPRFGADPPLQITLALAGSGVFALTVFFGFYFSHALGRGLLLAGTVAALFAAWRWWRQRHGWRTDLAPLAATFLLMFVLAGITFLYGGSQSAGEVPAGRHDLNLPSDNSIPEYFSEKIFHRQPLQPFLIDWLTSDRPPLQTGYLLQSRTLVSEPPGRLAAAIACQLAVYVGLWVLIGAIGLPRRLAQLTLLVCATSGFFVLNSLFAWPKLLPAGFLLAIAGLLYRLAREKRRAAPAEILALGACAALAMLGHGGSFFGLVALGFVHLAWHGGWRDVRLLAGSAAVAAVVFAPWLAYQKLVDPPGDRLVKYHLAGRTAIDPRGSLTVIAEAYRQTPAAEILRHKLSNFRVLAGDFTHTLPSLARAAWEAAAGNWRRAWWRTANALQGGMFFHLLQLLGVLSPGLLGLWFGRKKHPAWVAAGWYCVQIAVASVVVWSLLMFGPEGTVVHQGTYLTGALLLVACVLGLFAAGPAGWRWTLLGLHVLLFAGLWVFSPTWNPWQRVLRPGIDSFWLIVLFASAAAVLWVGRKLPVGTADEAGADRHTETT
jgi:hypothetical protein